MLNRIQILVILLVCLVVNITTSSIYSSQNLKTNFEKTAKGEAESESDSELDSKLQLEEFYHQYLAWNFTDRNSYAASHTFLFIHLISPRHHSNPIIKPPIFFA